MYIVLKDATSKFIFTPSTTTFSPIDHTDYSLLYIEAADGNEAASESGWNAWSYDALKETYRGSFWVDVKGKRSTWMFYFVYPPSSYSSITLMYVGPSGVDSATCGWKELPCVTINYAFKMKPDPVTRIELLEGSHTTIETNTTKITAGGFVIQRESSLESNPSKSVGALTLNGSTAVFLVDIESSSEVTIANIDFIVNEGGCGIVNVLSGKASLTSISVASFTPGSAVTMSSSAVSISSGGSASIASCTFTDLNCTGGNGAALLGDTSASITLTQCTFSRALYITVLSPIARLVLSSLVFDSCSASQSGGALYITGESFLSTLTPSSLTFTSCLAPSGKNLFFHAADMSLSALIEYSSWADLLPSVYSSVDDGAYLALHSSGVLDLLHLQFSPGDFKDMPLYVSPSSDGFEIPSCGWDDIPCKLVRTAFDHRYKTGSGFSILLTSGDHESETETTTFNQSTSIQSLNDISARKPVRSLSDSSASGVFILSEPSVTLTFKSILFQLITLNCPLFFQTSGTLSIQSLEVTSSGTSTTVHS